MKLSHRTPGIFLQLFHPHNVSSCLLLSPSLCMVLPRYLNSVTCSRWADFILTLPNRVPSRYVYTIFAPDTSIPLFSQASHHYSSSNCSTYFCLSHSTTSSANIICQGASFLMCSVSEFIMMANRKGLKADPWWRPTPTALVPAAHLTTVSHSPGCCTSLASLASHSSIQFFPRDSAVCFFQIIEHTV